jgi:hypothetical protein
MPALMMPALMMPALMMLAWAFPRPDRAWRLARSHAGSAWMAAR